MTATTPAHDNGEQILGEALAELDKKIREAGLTDAADDAAEALYAAGWWADQRQPFRTIAGDRFWFRPDLWVVALDVTDQYELGAFDEPALAGQWIKRIESVCFFDRSQITHLCQLRGSYFLMHLEDRGVFRDGCPVDVRERLDRELFQNHDQDTCHDCGTINRFIELHRTEPHRVAHLGNPGRDLRDFDGESMRERYAAMLEAERSELTANPPL